MRIVHLSDLHYSKRQEHNIAIVVKALIESFRESRDQNGPPDYIVFSGDLVHDADQAGTYDYFQDEVLEPLLKASGCSPERVIYCPGNHDVQRSGVKKHIDKLLGMTSRLSGREEINTALQDGTFLDITADKFSKYNEFLSYFDIKAKQNFSEFVTVYKFDSVIFVSINTAVMSWGGFEKRQDLRALLIPEAAIMAAIASLPQAAIKILVTHHPLNWLTEDCERDLKSTIRNIFKLHFFGHMHEPSPSFHAGIQGDEIALQAAALFSGRDRYIGYSITNLDELSGHVSVELQSFSDTRRVFHPAEQICEGGWFYPTLDDKKFWKSVTPSYSITSLKNWICDTLRPRLEKEYDAGFGDRRLCDLFVPPPLTTQVKVLESDKSKDSLPEITETTLDFSDFISSRANQIIYGRAEYGKTTLLRQCALANVQDSTVESKILIPILFNFQDITPGRDRIIRLLRSNLLAELPGITMQQLLVDGRVLVLIDDIDISVDSKMELIREFVQQYPKNRYIFSSHAGMSSRFVATPDLQLNVSVEAVFIKPLTRSAMRSLVSKWDADKKYDRKELLKKITAEISRINIPFTAVNGTILLTIYESRFSFKAINRAVLIENFIETLLDKRGPHSAERRTFDFTNQKHLLSAVSAWMAKSDNYTPTVSELRYEVQKYLDRYGLINDAQQLINDFTTCRIFEPRPETRISFRYRAFSEYFIASEMNLDASFKAWILEEGRYLSFHNEIQYYAGINRSDVSVIQLVADRFEILMARAISELGWEPNLDTLDKFQLPASSASSESLLDDLERQVGAPPLTEEERDSLLEADFPRDIENRQEVLRPKTKDVDQQVVLGLILFSGLVRDLELIPDDEKRKHLQKVFSAWGVMLMASLQIVPALAKQRRLKINGIIYEISMPKHFSDAEVARTLYVGMPSSLADFVLSALGTEKLHLQLSQPTLDTAGEPSIIEFMRNCLLSDLQLGSWWHLMPRYLESKKASNYLRQVALWKMRNIHMMGELPPKCAGEFRKSMATAIADMRGGSAAQHSEAKSNQIQRLTKADQLRRLRASLAD